MSGLYFLPLGVGDAFSQRWYSSCLLVESDGYRLLIDCPHPIRKILFESTKRSPLDLDSIDAVALTHLHADHCSGLEGLGFFFRFALQRKVRLLAHPRIAERLWQRLAPGMDSLHLANGDRLALSLEDYFDVVSLDTEKPVRTGPFEIECRFTQHHVPTTALRLRSSEMSLGYSADAAFDPALIEWLSQADRLIHETNLGTHTPYERLAALPSDLRERMWLIHYPDDFDAAASSIAPLEQGRRYVL